ncbi:MAG: hypothetical protein WC787_05215 [Patescibacteria group bacterium]|jgi:hypothetical protein
MLNLKRLRAFVAPLSLALTLGISAAPVAVYAQAAQQQSGLGGALSGGLQKAAPKELQGATDLNAIIGNLISAVIGFLGVILFVYMLYGGFLWMTAAGDSKKVSEATMVIRNAIIGLVIIASAYAIATFVITQLGTAVGGAGAGQGTPSATP